MVREVITDWSTAAGGGFASVMYFDEAFPVADARADLGTMWNSIDGQLSTSTTWTIRTDGRTLNTATGALEGKWLDNTVQTGSGGDAASSPVPDLAQVLLRWQTEVVVRGRLLQGRTFIPGAVVGDVTSGNVGAVLLNAVNAAAATFVAAGNGFVIWHRPRNGAGGVAASVESSGAWTEWAGLRRRRR